MVIHSWNVRALNHFFPRQLKERRGGQQGEVFRRAHGRLPHAQVDHAAEDGRVGGAQGAEPEGARVVDGRRLQAAHPQQAERGAQVRGRRREAAGHHGAAGERDGAEAEEAAGAGGGRRGEEEGAGAEGGRKAGKSEDGALKIRATFTNCIHVV